MKMLKAACVFAMLLMPLPLLICTDYYAVQSLSIVHLLIFYDIGIMLLFIARFFGVAVKNGGKTKVLRFSAAAVGVVLSLTALICGYLLFPNSLSGMLLGLGAVFFYILGWQLGKLPPQKVFSTVQLGVFTGVSLLCYILFIYSATDFALEIGKLVIVICYAVVFSIAAWNKNQENITRQLERRSGENVPLQSRIRRFNAGLTLVFCVAFCGSILLAGTVASVFTGWLKALVIMILNGLTTVSEVAPPEEVVEDELPDGSILSFSESAVGIILTTVLQVLAVVALVVAIIFAIRIIIRKVNNALERKTEIIDEKKESYIDYFEDRKPASKKQKIDIKKLYKQYKNEKSAREKYKLGYKIFLLHIKDNGDEKISTETANQHLKFAQKLGENHELVEFSTGYSSLKYDDMNPDENAIKKLDELLKELVAQK